MFLPHLLPPFRHPPDPATDTQTPVTLASTTSISDAEWHKGLKLDVRWFLDHYSCLTEEKAKVNGKVRSYMTCLICKKHESAACRMSANGKVFMADKVRVGDKVRLQRVVDHLLGKPHAAALEEEALEGAWQGTHDDHPWLAVMKKSNAHVVSLLTHMAVEVYNDSLLETPSAWSWPARSLAPMHADHVVAITADNQAFTPLRPAASDLRYRSPTAYREMLDVISSLERDRLGERLQRCLVYSVQIDGSMDRTQRDNKFVTARLMTPDGKLETAFINVTEPESAGAEGLMEAVKSSLAAVKAPLEKLTRVTTDGESANTGRMSGLLARLKDFLNRDIMTMWCVCHRSDLAMEAVEASVPELKHWKSDLAGLIAHFRTSKNRMKAVREHPGTVVFPAHFEVRFAEHHLQCCRAVLTNLDACRAVWKQVAEGTEKGPKNEAVGFLKRWREDGTTVRLTAVMHDICFLFTHLQKKLQLFKITLPEVLEVRDSAISQIGMMLNEPLPGGKEGEMCDRDATDDGSSRRRVVNSNVTSSRSFDAVRQEVVQSAINFLEERLSLEQQGIVSVMQALVDAESAKAFVASGESLARDLFGDDRVVELVTSTCDQWRLMHASRLKAASFGDKLWAMFGAATGLCKELLASLIVLTSDPSQHGYGTGCVPF